MINSSGTWKITKLLLVAIFEKINLQEKFEGQYLDEAAGAGLALCLYARFGEGMDSRS